MKNIFSVIFEKFNQTDYSGQIVFLSKLLYIISMLARDTYEAGTNKVNQPQLLRRYNELLHRTSTQQLYVAKSKLDRMPDDIFFEMFVEEVTYLGIADSVIRQLELLDELNERNTHL